MEGNDAAEPEYAAATIAVWWDMSDCPIPEGYDARRVRPSIEGRFKKQGYSGPVSITAYGDQKQTPVHILRGLSSTGVVVAHTSSKSTCSLMFSDMLEWRALNPPPATMMLISNRVEDVFSCDLARLQQETKYNLFLAFSNSCNVEAVLVSDGKWRWNELLGSANNEHEEIICRETSAAMFYCKSCNLVGQSLVKFRKHLSSTSHDLEEITNPTYIGLHPVTRKWARNYQAKPEYAAAKIAVWWDMSGCPIPEGYDPRWVRSSIEGAFKHLGYSGPVSITAYADQTPTDDQILQGLSSTGVDVVHTNSDVTSKCMFSNMCLWEIYNPPPATMMVISNQLETGFSIGGGLVMLQQVTKYNLFVAYSYRPYKMPFLVTSAEWLWESLLACHHPETRRPVLQKCSGKGGQSTETRTHVLEKCSEKGESTGSSLAGHHPETRRHALQKCSGEGQSTETRTDVLGKCSEKGESTGLFYCKTCDCDCKSLDNFREHLSSKEHAHVKCESTGMFYCETCDCDWKSLGNFREHLSSKEHANEEFCIIANFQLSEYERSQTLKEDYFQRTKFPRRKRSRKAFRTGFRLFHNHLHLTNRGARRRTQKILNSVVKLVLK